MTIEQQGETISTQTAVYKSNFDNIQNMLTEQGLTMNSEFRDLHLKIDTISRNQSQMTETQQNLNNLQDQDKQKILEVLNTMYSSIENNNEKHDIFMQKYENFLTLIQKSSPSTTSSTNTTTSLD